MLVLHLIPYLYQGAARSVITLSYELSRLGHSVVIATSRNSDGIYFHQKGMIELAESNDIEIIYIDTVFKRDLSLLFNSASELYNRLGCVDVINAHSGAATFLASIYRDLFSQSTKVVSTVRGLGNASKLEWHYSMDQYSYHNSDAVVAISKYVAKSISSAGIDSKLSVIYNGIDMSRRFTVVSKGNHKDTNFKFVSVGDLCLRKNQVSIIDALRYIPNVEVHFYGTGDDESYLLQKAIDYGISSKVFFHGYVCDVSEELGNYDCFILTPKDEAFGLVFVEAMIAGLPIISSKIGAIPEVIPLEYHNFLWDGVTLESLVKIIEYAIDNRDVLHEYSCANSARANTYFSSKLNALNTESLYLKLMSPNSTINCPNSTINCNTRS